MSWAFTRPWRELQVDVNIPTQGQRLLSWRARDQSPQSRWQQDQIYAWWRNLRHQQVTIAAETRLNPLFAVPEHWDFEGEVKQSFAGQQQVGLVLDNNYWLEAEVSSIELDAVRNMAKVQTAVGRTYWVMHTRQKYRHQAPLHWQQQHQGRSHTHSRDRVLAGQLSYHDSYFIYETPIPLQDLSSATGFSVGIKDQSFSFVIDDFQIGVNVGFESFAIEITNRFDSYGLAFGIAEDSVVIPLNPLFVASSEIGISFGMGKAESAVSSSSYTVHQYEVLELSTFGNLLADTFWG